MLVWWAAEIECISALSRLERSGTLDLEGTKAALAQLDRLRSSWAELEPSAAVRIHARRLPRVHPLTAADAFRLAAALVAAEGRPSDLPFVTLDRRLADAAHREGLPVVVPASASEQP
jgi:predicted nucleic acid-binding protein